MKYTLNISDADVMFVDNVSKDIRVSSSLLPDVVPGDTVEIYYEEDGGNCSHIYGVSHIEGDVVFLNWESTSEMLNEADPTKRIQKAVQKGRKKAQKTLNKIDKRFEKLANKDMANGHDWRFYIELPDGEHVAEPLSYENIQGFYQLPLVSPAIINAIVTTKKGYIVRKGKQDIKDIDLYIDGVTSVDNLYHEAWSPEEVNQFNQFLKDNPDIASLIKRHPKTKTPKKNPKKNPEDDTQTKVPVKDPIKVDQPSGSITQETMKNVGALCKATGMQIVDENGKPELAPETIPASQVSKYYAVANGKEYQLDKWIERARKDPTLSKMLKEGLTNMTNKELTEATLQLTSDEMSNPSRISLKDVARRAVDAENAEQARIELEKSQESLKALVGDEFLNQLRSCSETNKCVSLLFDKFVPDRGQAETVAGELIRALVRIQYRDWNDGDKFFEGYGIETCGSSACYLYDNGFESKIDEILEDAYRLSDNDDEYTKKLDELADNVVTHIKDNERLMWTKNDTDSRDYDCDYIIENQPRYEFEIYGSEDVDTLVERGVVNAWDLVNYIEDQLRYDSAYSDAEVDRPWSHHSTSLTVSNLTKDGYDALEGAFSRDVSGWWEDFVSEYSDELEDEYDDNAPELDDNSEQDEF